MAASYNNPYDVFQLEDLPSLSKLPPWFMGQDFNAPQSLASGIEVADRAIKAKDANYDLLNREAMQQAAQGMEGQDLDISGKIDAMMSSAISNGDFKSAYNLALTKNQISESSAINKQLNSFAKMASIANATGADPEEVKRMFSEFSGGTELNFPERKPANPRNEPGQSFQPKRVYNAMGQSELASTAGRMQELAEKGFTYDKRPTLQELAMERATAEMFGSVLNTPMKNSAPQAIPNAAQDSRVEIVKGRKKKRE